MSGEVSNLSCLLPFMSHISSRVRVLETRGLHVAVGPVNFLLGSLYTLVLMHEYLLFSILDHCEEFPPACVCSAVEFQSFTLFTF